MSLLPKKILYWYDNNKRILPWRIKTPKNKKEYYVLVSEFMLQQTQVKTVIPYFIKFVTKIPNLKSLSTSNEKKVLKLWEGLGYYRRARNLHKTAKILIKNYNGKLPKKFAEIIKLPGVGEYTANSLSALVHNKACIPVDGNVKRVFSRLFLIYESNKNFHKEVKKITNKLPNTSRNADLAEALMEFGATVCRPKNPLCKVCNLRNYCKFFKREIYIPKKKKYYFKEKKFTWNRTGGDPITQGNRNPLLYKNIGADGIKTGHLAIAKYSLAASIFKNNRRLIFVGSGFDTKNSRSKESTKLLVWGLTNFDTIKIAVKNNKFDSLDVWLGKKAKIDVYTKEDVYKTIPKARKKYLKGVVEYTGPILAPIKKNDIVGKLKIFYKDDLISEYDLYASENIKKVNIFSRILKSINYLIWGDV